MKKKTKLIMMFMSLCLVISLGVLGIFAVKTLNMSVGGNITFSADGIDVSVSQGKFYTKENADYSNITTQTGKMQSFAMTTNTKLSEIESKINSWSNLVLVLDSKGDAVLKFTVTNNMTADTLYIHTAITLGTNQNNNMDIIFSPTLLTVEATQQKEISITFDILNTEINAGLTGFNIGIEFTKVFEVDNGGGVSSGASEKFTKTNYEINENGGVTVTSKENISGEVAILGAVEIDGVQYQVTEVSKNAFNGCDKITSVNIPNSVTKIDYQAFYNCSNLKEVHLPSNLQIIEASAFYNCRQLKGVFNLPSTLTQIGGFAFYYCAGLTGNVYISKNVQAIGINPFMGSSVTGIKVDENNPLFDSRNNCNAIIDSRTNVLISGCNISQIPNDVSEIGYAAFFECKERTGDLILPATVKKIGAYAFYNCSKYTGNLVLSEQLESVANAAFIATKFTGELRIPASLHTISGDNPFAMGTLSSIVVDSNNTVFDSRNNCNAIIKKDTKTLISGCNETVIPSEIKAIGSHAFSYCSKLKSVNLPNGLETIGSSAFTATGLTGELVIPATVTSIGSNPFRACEKITSIKVEAGNTVYDSRNNCNAIIHTATNEMITICTTTTIDSTVEILGEYLFYYLGFLSGDFIIPSNIKQINKYAFTNCVNLTSITFQSPNNWVVSSTTNKEDCIEINLANPITNKGYLTETYTRHYFFKV